MDDAELFKQVAGRLKAGEAAALATVVEASGSTPQKPGAKMAVLPSGSMLGTVGGGCVEGEVKSACLDALLRTREARLIEISLTDDAAAEEGDVCGGTMRVLVEPLFP
jgi:xanthine dehydrogenase accessory factor